MSVCVLIQANGNGTRMREYFDMPKHHLFYNGERIIDIIIKNCRKAYFDAYIASKYNEDYIDNLIACHESNTRMETLKQCMPILKGYDSVIVHDCDVIFEPWQLSKFNGNMLSVSRYKGDGIKYGFVGIDEQMRYKFGNEKLKEEPFISTGAYCFDYNDMKNYLNGIHGDSMLDYYNTHKPKLFFSENHKNLGDIESYFNNL